MNLFCAGNFQLHSGGVSRWKIDCDALTEADWDTLALMIVERVGDFSGVYGVPRGGVALAEALKPYRTPRGPVLIVDDVLTTGRSMEEARAQFSNETRGVVVFARTRPPDWITAVFTLWGGS